MRSYSAKGIREVVSFPNKPSWDETATYTKYLLERSDSISTKKVGGRFVLPTPYYYLRWTQAIVPYESTDRKTSNYYKRGESLVYIYTVDHLNPVAGVPLKNLINKAIKNVHTQKVAGGVFLGEAKSSLAMIASRSRQIFRIFSSAKRLDVMGVIRELRIAKKPSRVFKDANDLLLEYRFGWLPLFQEIYAACQALQERDKFRNSIVTTSARHTTTTKNLTNRHNRAVDELLREFTLEQRVYLTYELRRPQGSLRELFGIDDPLKTAYELVPLSFVLDWFLPIGDFLTALNVSGNVKFLHGCSVHKLDVKITPTVPRSGYIFTDGVKSSVITKFSRQVIYDGSVSLPRLQVPFSMSKAFTAVQLILQRL